ncbi:polyprenyl synthetase family protein [Streptomyces sp. Q6]|uniref:Polyprenyl synthetase family protein n=1 Tax=Streptomyces citrinus TaxID=3118173 RepID=A0ACD5ANB0_9ACTN
MVGAAGVRPARTGGGRDRAPPGGRPRTDTDLRAGPRRHHGRRADAPRTPGDACRPLLPAPAGSGVDRARFGQSAAILAGDLALAWADDEVAALEPPRGRAGAVREVWARMRMEMVAGQYLDIHGEFTRERSVGRAVRAACLKTALYTVERPLQLGALLGGADEDTVRALCSAGRCAGLAFQLRDDLDDVFGGPRHDKPAGQDVRSGKPTYLAAVAQARAESGGDRRALAVLRRSLGRSDLDDRGLAEVREVFDATGAARLVEEKIARLVAQGLRHLDSVAVDPVASERLVALMRTAVKVPSHAAHAAHQGVGSPECGMPFGSFVSVPAEGSR